MSSHDTSSNNCALLRSASSSSASGGEADATANRITNADRSAISQYFEGRWSLANVTRQASPSKLRRRWMIGGKLPASVHTDGLPRELENQLSTLETGFERLLVGCDVLCVDVGNCRIVDVMHNAGAAASQHTAQLLIQPADSARPA
ncbi:MAG TPA: hypothetical protein VGO84_07895 [Burkholderiales bacterium]|jgi:hypothetical protein|nr:hypothetical protein [Burkholderiales bacterium]